MGTSFYTAVDGLKNLYWRNLDVASAIATYNQAAVVAAASTGGLWTLTLNTVAMTTACPSWEFTTPVLPTAYPWMVFVRLSNLTPPVDAQDAGAVIGVADAHVINNASGYRYPTGTVNIQGLMTIDDFAPTTYTAALARAGVTSVFGSIAGFLASAYLSAAAYDTTADDSLGSPLDSLMVSAFNPGVNPVTFSFQPQYALVNAITLESI